jgi:hypothetical protein
VREEGSVAAVLLVSGIALALLTDVVVDRSAFQPTGAEAATSLLAVSYLDAVAFLLNDHFHLQGAPALRLAFTWSAAVLGLAAWRWGFRLYAGAAVIAALLVATQFPGPRLVWIAAAASLAIAAGTALTRQDLTPSHRGGLEFARTIALAAIYAAVNYYSVDRNWIEEIGRAAGAPRHRPGEMALLLAGAASALYPLGLLARGLRTRDRALLDLGILTAVLSVTTLLFYVRITPHWAVLAVSGAAVAGGSLLLERWLRAGREGERAGFTATPLFDEERRGRLLPVAAAIAMAPEARSLPEEPRGVRGGGGGFGGGGAGGAY